MGGYLNRVGKLAHFNRIIFHHLLKIKGINPMPFIFVNMKINVHSNV